MNPRKPETRIVNGFIEKRCRGCNEFISLLKYRAHFEGYLGFRSQCKECEQKGKTRYNKLYNKEIYFSKILKKFNLTEEKYNELIKNGCMICGSINNLHVDHCHNLNIFRGILCINCNTGIGSFFDNPDLLLKAASYIENFKRKNEVKNEEEKHEPIK